MPMMMVDCMATDGAKGNEDVNKIRKEGMKIQMKSQIIESFVTHNRTSITDKNNVEKKERTCP